jgi:hypothetical protein
VFDVTKIREEDKKPLREVSATIRGQLTKQLQKQALTRFAARWQATWVARTSCSPGEIVPGCRESKGSVTGGNATAALDIASAEGP